MLLDIPIQHEYELLLENDSAKKMEIISFLASEIEKEFQKLNIHEMNEKLKPKNKWGEIAIKHASIDSEKIGNIDLGEIIRKNNQF